jgi:hypothetical protein
MLGVVAWVVWLLVLLTGASTAAFRKRTRIGMRKWAEPTSSNKSIVLLVSAQRATVLGWFGNPAKSSKLAEIIGQMTTGRRGIPKTWTQSHLLKQGSC